MRNLLWGVLFSFFGMNLIAQSPNLNLKLKKKIVKEILYTLESKVDTTFISTDLYENDKIVESRFFIKNELHQKSFFIRDDNGNIQKIINTDSKNKNSGYSLYQYDQNENLNNIKKYSIDNELLETVSFKFDNRKNILEKKKVGHKRNYYYKSTFVYNKNDQKIEESIYTSKDKLYNRQKYVYDRNGNEVKRFVYYPDGRIVKIVSKFDRNNNIIEEYHSNRKGPDGLIPSIKLKFKYVYDKHGNWIIKKRSTDNKFDMVWERKFDYN